MTKIVSIKTLTLALLIIFFTATSFAQEPPPPPGDPSSGNTNPPVGGGAPVGSGLAILVALGLGYGFKKYRET